MPDHLLTSDGSRANNVLTQPHPAAIHHGISRGMLSVPKIRRTTNAAAMAEP